MHPTDLEALAYLCRADEGAHPLAPGELSDAISLSPPATSAMLSRLERAGHIRREQDKQDGRRVLIHPQPSAVEAVGAFYEPLGQAIAQAVADFSADERRVLEEAIERIVHATQAARLDAAAREAGGE
jgi:DNA-binding MarR family transcriptional regulator